MLTATELDAMRIGQIVVNKIGSEWRKVSIDRWELQDGGEGDGPHASALAGFGVRRKESHVEQPMPTASTGASMHELAVGEIRYRADVGLDRYGQPLQAMNGRDAVRDTIEELADGLAYALQIREERRLLREELMALAGDHGTVDFRMTLRDIINRYFPKESS